MVPYYNIFSLFNFTMELGFENIYFTIPDVVISTSLYLEKRIQFKFNLTTASHPHLNKVDTIWRFSDCRQRSDRTEVKISGHLLKHVDRLWESLQ